MDRSSNILGNKSVNGGGLMSNPIKLHICSLLWYIKTLKHFEYERQI